jgi:excisionase family DNA binding protein
MSERLVITVREAARLMGVSERRLYALVADGVLPEGIVIRLGRAIRLSAPRLFRWLGADAGRDGVDPETPAPGAGQSATSEQILRRSASDDCD